MRALAALLLLFVASAAACGSSNDDAGGGETADAGLGADGTSPESSTDTDGGATADGAPTGLEVSVHAVVDLPGTFTHALSATAYDPATRTLYALQDTQPFIVPLEANADFDAFVVGIPLELTGRTDSTWDGEGLVRDATGFVAVTVETAPTVERFGLTGLRTGAVTFPARFADQAPGNKGLESLTLSPSGRYLFTANESALTSDGTAATKTKGSTVRILRRELATGADTESAYRTEPLGAGGATGDMGVSELAALSDDVVLVLERGFQPGYGNTVRIFRVDVSSGEHVEGVSALNDATPVLTKTLVVDLSTLPPGNTKHPATQPNPLLDNYEALAVGPTLADGRRLLFVTSDDNASMTQVARVLVLAVQGL